MFESFNVLWSGYDNWEKYQKIANSPDNGLYCRKTFNVSGAVQG